LAGELPPNLKAVIDKTQSFGLGRYPISFWNLSHVGSHAQYLNEAAVAEWADAGFTVPQSPRYDLADAEQKAHMLRLLDWAGKYNMKLILSDPRCFARTVTGGTGGVIPADYADGVRAAVKDFGSHPATFGFHVGDEPDAKMKEAFFACYRTQKEIAPHLFPYANLLPCFSYTIARAGAETWPKYLDEYATKSQADMVGYDCYTQMNAGCSGWDAYYENLRLYREASLRNGIPFWNTILSVGHLRYRCPTLDDIRWQFYTSIASGANGISWFFYYLPAPNANYRLAPVDENWEKTLTYYDIRRVQKNFHRLYGDLFARLVSTRVTFFPKAFGGGKPFTPNGLVSKISTDVPDHPVLLGEFADVQGRRYVMLVNNSMTDDVIVSISFPGKDTRVFSWNWAGKEYEGGTYCAIGRLPDENGLTIQHALAPGQEAVYRVQSASASTQPFTATE
jgi:hypothetical protein